MTRQIKVGNVIVGGGSPVSIQSMLNTATADVAGSLVQINKLKDAGCQIVRLAVPDMEAAEGFAKIAKQSPLPLVADIHFDYRLAIAAAEGGAAKIPINPGNIGGEDRVRAVCDACAARHIPIRIGVNGGSLEKELLARMAGQPTYTFEVIATEKKPEKRSYAGLTMDLMEDYLAIWEHELADSARAKFAEMKAKQEKKELRFSFIKSWFLEEFKHFNVNQAKTQIAKHELADRKATVRKVVKAKMVKAEEAKASTIALASNF